MWSPRPLQPAALGLHVGHATAIISQPLLRCVCVPHRISPAHAVVPICPSLPGLQPPPLCRPSFPVAASPMHPISFLTGGVCVHRWYQSGAAGIEQMSPRDGPLKHNCAPSPPPTPLPQSLTPPRSPAPPTCAACARTSFARSDSGTLQCSQRRRGSSRSRHRSRTRAPTERSPAVPNSAPSQERPRAQ